MGHSLWLPYWLSAISDLLHVHTCRPVCQLLHAGEILYKFSQLFKIGPDDIYPLQKKKKKKLRKYQMDFYFLTSSSGNLNLRIIPPNRKPVGGTQVPTLIQHTLKIEPNSSQ